MRRLSLLLGLLIFIGAAGGVRADLVISIDSVTVPANQVGSPTQVNVYITSTTGDNLGDFSYQLNISPDLSSNNGVLEFAPTSPVNEQLTFNQLPSNYVFSGVGVSAGITYTPNDPVGTPSVPPQPAPQFPTQFNGGDVDISSANDGNVFLPAGQTFLLTSFFVVGDQGVPPMAGSSFLISLAMDSNTVFNTYDANTGSETPIAYTSTSGTFTVGPAVAVPVPASLVMLGGGFLATLLPRLIRRR